VIDVIDTVEIDLDSTDRDGELPPQVVATLHLHGDFQATCEKYMGIDEPDGRYGSRMDFRLNHDVAVELHDQLTRILF